MTDGQSSPDPGAENDPTPKLSPDEAKAVIRAISEVEREEAEADADSTAADDA